MNYKYGIIAIHGGRIEPGTGEIARALAEDDFFLYINEKGPHITSTEFRNDELDCLLKQCDTISSWFYRTTLSAQITWIGSNQCM